MKPSLSLDSLLSREPRTALTGGSHWSLDRVSVWTGSPCLMSVLGRGPPLCSSLTACTGPGRPHGLSVCVASRECFQRLLSLLFLWPKAMLLAGHVSRHRLRMLSCPYLAGISESMGTNTWVWEESRKPYFNLWGKPRSPIWFSRPLHWSIGCLLIY